MKKTKKPKEKVEEEATKETDEKGKEKPENETEGTKEDPQDEEAAKESDDSSYRTPNVVNMPSGEQKPLIRQDIGIAQRAPGTSAIPQQQESSRAAKGEGNTPEKEKARGKLSLLFQFQSSKFEFCLLIVKNFYDVVLEF